MLPAERATLQQPDQRVAGIAEEAEHAGRAQRLSAARTRSGSIRRTAWTVVRNIGKNVAYVMKPTLDSSPMPIHTMKSGSIASGGIGRSSSTTGSTARRTA